MAPLFLEDVQITIVLLCINQKVLDASIYYTIFNLQMKKVPVKNTNI